MLRQKLGVKVRGIELSLLQRCGAHLASGSDVSEAFAVGRLAVESALAGETDKMVAIKRVTENGKVSFTTEQLLENVRALVDAVQKAKPTGAKGTYLQRVAVSSTMGPGVKVDPSSVATAS